MPELPVARRERFQSALGLPEYDSRILTANRSLADYFEQVVAKSVMITPNWLPTG